MVASNPGRDRRRGTLIIRHVGIDPERVDAEFVEFLGRRRLVGGRVLGVAAFVAAALFALYFWEFFTLPDGPDAAQARHLSWWVGVIATLIGAVFFLAGQVTGHLDVRAARRLPMRVGRSERYGAVTVIGPVAMAAAVLIVALHVLVLVGLFVAPSPLTAAYRWGYLIGMVGCTALAVAGARRAIDRPAIATDPISLAVDERLRSREAVTGFGAFIMLGSVGIPVSAQASMPGWFALVELVTFPGTMALLFVATSMPPWKKPPRFRRPRQVTYQ